MSRYKITRANLRAWLDVERDAPISLGLPLGAPRDGEEDIVLYVDVDESGATAGEAKPRECQVQGCGRHVGDCPHGARP